MRAAKAKSAERGESLKALLTRAVEAEVGIHAKAGPASKRVTFPMLRSLSNSAVLRQDSVTRRQAWNLVLALQEDPRIRFLQEPQGLAPIWITLSKRDDQSHKFWTDDYLAAFAQAAHADLVTLDRSMHGRYPSVTTAGLKPVGSIYLMILFASLSTLSMYDTPSVSHFGAGASFR